MSELNFSEREVIREVIDRPESVLMVRLTTTDNDNNYNNNDDDSGGREVAVANVHVWWSQLKYPALQALQVAVDF